MVAFLNKASSVTCSTVTSDMDQTFHFTLSFSFYILRHNPSLAPVIFKMLQYLKNIRNKDAGQFKVLHPHYNGQVCHSSGLLYIRQQHTYFGVHSLQHSRYTDNGTAVSACVPGFIMKYWPELKQSRVREAIQLKNIWPCVKLKYGL